MCSLFSRSVSCVLYTYTHTATRFRARDDCLRKKISENHLIAYNAQAHGMRNGARKRPNSNTPIQIVWKLYQRLSERSNRNRIQKDWLRFNRQNKNDENCVKTTVRLRFEFDSMKRRINEQCWL